MGFVVEKELLTQNIIQYLDWTTIKASTQIHPSPWSNLSSARPVEVEAAWTGLGCPPAQVRFKVAYRLGFWQSRCGQSLAIVLTEMGIDEES